MSSDLPPPSKSNAPVHIRWMIRRDMPGVLAIEDASLEFPWCEEEFIRCLRQRNCTGMIAELDDKVVGFMIYELHKNRLHILNFAVDPDQRRQGIGSTMMGVLAGKLSAERRNRIMLEVRETNLEMQIFLKELGFKAISVLRDFYEDTVEDAYLMQYRDRSLPQEHQRTKTALETCTKCEWNIGNYNDQHSFCAVGTDTYRDLITSCATRDDSPYSREYTEDNLQITRVLRSSQPFKNPQAAINELSNILSICNTHFKVIPINANNPNDKSGYIELEAYYTPSMQIKIPKGHLNAFELAPPNLEVADTLITSSAKKGIGQSGPNSAG